MNKTIILALLLAGCAHHPAPLVIDTPDAIVIDGQSIGSAPAPKMPALPQSLAKKAGALPPLTDPTVVGQQADGAATDRLYNAVSLQMNNVIDAWDCVRGALNDQKNPSECFKEK